MIRFTLFGIPVEVQPFFWLTAALLGGAIHARTPQDMLAMVLFMIAAFVSILVHELGHALTARKFGASTQIVLQAFGGYATCEGIRLTRLQDFAMTAAGPFVQILLGVALFFTLPHLNDLNENIAEFVGSLMLISIFWAVLNLLPVLPLDGGRLLNAILGPQRIRITLWTTIIVAITVAILMVKFTGSILFPVFLGMFAWQAWQGLSEHRRF